VAAKAFCIAPEYKDECLTLYQEISDAMLNGEMWKKRKGSGICKISLFIILHFLVRWWSHIGGRYFS